MREIAKSKTAIGLGFIQETLNDRVMMTATGRFDEYEKSWRLRQDTFELIATALQQLGCAISEGTLGRNRPTSMDEYTDALHKLVRNARSAMNRYQQGSALVHALRGLFYYDQQDSKVYVVTKKGKPPTAMRPGKYFKQLGLSQDEANELTNILRSCAPVEDTIALYFSTCSETAAEIYTSGPSSCMSHGMDTWYSGYHPAEVYATDDVCVVAVERLGRVVARAIFNKKDGTYTAPYGNEALLENVMDAYGYTRAYDALTGCRLKAIYSRHAGAWVGPYVDGASAVYLDDEGKYFVVDDCLDGTGIEFMCDNTDGIFTEGAAIICDSCGDRFHEDDVTYLNDTDVHICSCCLDYEYIYSDHQCTYIVSADAMWSEALGSHVEPDVFYEYEEPEDEECYG